MRYSLNIPDEMFSGSSEKGFGVDDKNLDVIITCMVFKELMEITKE